MQFTVQNMSCGHCVGAITRAIHAIDAGARVDVDLAAGTVTVLGDIAAEQAAAAIVAAGYPVAATGTA